MSFQSTPPHGERPSAGPPVAPSTLFQSTPPHGERLDRVIDLTREDVSIHAPARGATTENRFGPRTSSCLNPRPRTGSDTAGAVVAVYSEMFQSTPPHGERRLPRRRGEVCDGVSIHAPARGATRIVMSSPPFSIRFNPRPRTGSDAARRKGSTSGRVFQSTPPHGERPRGARGPATSTSFNPRPRTGSDGRRRSREAGHGLFQSTPPHGERRGGIAHDRAASKVSIHAPARGATEADQPFLPFRGFQSTPPHGERRAAAVLPGPDRGFNPRPRTGSDAVQSIPLRLII